MKDAAAQAWIIEGQITDTPQGLFRPLVQSCRRFLVMRTALEHVIDLWVGGVKVARPFLAQIAIGARRQRCHAAGAHHPRTPQIQQLDWPLALQKAKAPARHVTHPCIPN